MTEPFEVEPNHLDAAAGKLQAVADDNGHTETYLAQWLELPESKEGLILQGLTGVIRELMTKLQSNYSQLGRVTGESAAELVASARMYRTTDNATAAALDSAYDKGDR